jgi:hypothetical protein
MLHRAALGETQSFNALLYFRFHEPRSTATDRMSVGEVDLPASRRPVESIPCPPCLARREPSLIEERLIPASLSKNSFKMPAEISDGSAGFRFFVGALPQQSVEMS